MVKKEGPCYHCGTMRSPLWRHGPPEKPVLCNACGTRWRTKGTLDNYTPARRPEDAEAETKQPKKRPIRRMAKKKPSLGTMLGDADTSNPSGFGSAVSYSGSAQSHARESPVPSRKKTFVRRRKLSVVETLAEDLNSIMHEEKLCSGSGVRTIPGSSEEDLIYHRKSPAGSFEIGYGSMLLRHPADSKSYITSGSYSYPGPASFGLHSGRNKASNSNAASEKLMCSPMRAHESARRDRPDYPKQRILENMDSALVSVPVEFGFPS
ncbi:GATA transcription factor 26-like [Hordeum vulgare subsp. vulgare]|uniref:GATA transcription factor 26-like n=1 Tax=Hordeum vulgare subsp. vulgare TaxID=112509 RepID=UPI001D1A51F8|nr:GATA transcription factor 26-like [Hordeum vulgare subsp. vulgare]